MQFLRWFLLSVTASSAIRSRREGDGAARKRLNAEKSRPTVTISGNQLLVNGQPFHMKGICWNPVGKGGRHPANLDWRGFAASDAEMMVEAGINVVRTYEPLTLWDVLDTFWEKGIYVVNSAYSWGGASMESVRWAVNEVKWHPAILMWTVGNEWNYNMLYFEHELDFEKTRARVAEVVRIVKENDNMHPVSTIYGEIPSVETVNILSEVDIWSINAYRGGGFWNLFDQFKAVCDKPMFFGEYGADAWDARGAGALNESAQAYATRVLTEEIVAESAFTGGICNGGFVFEWADEWWKDYYKNPWEHDVGGIAPGGGPYPDMTFNEEYWGIVDIDRKPREAFYAYKSVAPPTR